jgi:acetyl-CoA carboxylase carboxyltransferase component
MAPEAALRTVHRRRLEANPDERARLLNEMESQAGPFQAAMNGAVDDIIEPHEARKYLITCLETVRGQRSDFVGRHLLQTWPTGF